MRRRFRPALTILTSTFLTTLLTLTLVATAVPALAAPALVGAAPAAVPGRWRRPVAGPVVRGFRAPLTRYGAGHLGVDLAAPAGTLVRAAGAGTVVFSGVVAGTRHVVVRHAGGWRTSYSFLATTRVRVGESVSMGDGLGTSGGTGEHHGGDVVHLGLRVGETYVDPMVLFGPPDLAAVVHLAPAPGGAPVFATGLGPEAGALERGLVGRPAPGATDVPSGPAAFANPLRSVVAGRRTASGRPLYPR